MRAALMMAALTLGLGASGCTAYSFQRANHNNLVQAQDGKIYLIRGGGGLAGLIGFAESSLWNCEATDPANPVCYKVTENYLAGK